MNGVINHLCSNKKPNGMFLAQIYPSTSGNIEYGEIFIPPEKIDILKDNKYESVLQPKGLPPEVGAKTLRQLVNDKNIRDTPIKTYGETSSTPAPSTAPSTAPAPSTPPAKKDWRQAVKPAPAPAPAPSTAEIRLTNDGKCPYCKTKPTDSDGNKITLLQHINDSNCYDRWVNANRPEIKSS